MDVCLKLKVIESRSSRMVCVRTISALFGILLFCELGLVRAKIFDTVSMVTVYADRQYRSRRICTGSLEISRNNPEEVLLGISPLSGKSGAIGIILRDAWADKATILYGNLSYSYPPNVTRSLDGIGNAAYIGSPNNMYQTSDGTLLFVDSTSCAREVNRATGDVITRIGICDGSGLKGLGVSGAYIEGMTYIEEKELWVFSVYKLGIYIFSKNGDTKRLLLPRSELSREVADAAFDLERGRDYLGKRTNIIWHKVKHGINRYDMTNVTANHGNLTHGENFVRYISASNSSIIDTSALRHDQNDPKMGRAYSDMNISPQGDVLLSADTLVDKLHFFKLDKSVQTASSISVVAAQEVSVCPPDDTCSFNSITAVMWLSSSTVVVYDYTYGRFVIVKLVREIQEIDVGSTGSRVVTSTTCCSLLAGTIFICLGTVKNLFY